MFLQDLWHAKLDWDDPLPQQHLDQWTTSVDNLAELNTISLPRYIGPPANINQCTYALLCFCDASGKAYATAVYLRTTWSTGSTTTLAFCKTRLAPTKKVTIPRLELMATVLGIRCLRFVRAQLHLPLQTQDTLWTDSQCVPWVVTLTTAEGSSFRGQPSAYDPNPSGYHPPCCIIE